jgi:hypothetical protein
VSPPLGNKFDELGGIRNRIRIGHCVDCGETARRRGSRTRQYRFGSFTARLAKMRVQVDETGESDESVCIDHSIGCGIG